MRPADPVGARPGGALEQFTARAERVTRRRSTHDALTDLPNRELLTETVAAWADEVSEEHQEISLLFLDLDWIEGRVAV
ncbi:MAG TPA: GGDEF domain-containing protein [Actinoplanes sp.]